MSSTSLIVDGSNLAHRCRHVFNLSTCGTDVSIHYGFLRVLYSKVQDFEPDCVVVCWDNGVPSYRKDNYPEYKAHRSHDDDEGYASYLTQVDELHELLPKMGVASVRKYKTEADDFIVQSVRNMSGHKIVMSSDKDMLSIVADDVTVYTPSKDEEITPENFEAIAGVPQKYWYTFRLLVGDSSDGIAGVKGVGPKTAKKLLEQYPDHFVFPKLIQLAEEEDLGAIGKRILETGIDGFERMICAIGYEYDIAGATRALKANLELWRRFELKSVKRVLKERAYVSLLDPDFYEAFGSLQSPMNVFEYRTEHVPVVCEYRKAI